VFVLLAALAACRTTGDVVYLLKIERGDTLASVAAKYDTTPDKIARLNDLAPGNLTPGQTLRVSPGPYGRIAGAAPASAKAVAGTSRQRRARRGASEANGNAAANEFVEEDFLNADDAALKTPAALSTGRGGARGGLLFGGGTDALTWPIHGEISSSYGTRHGRLHAGVDIRAPKGTPVHGAGPGVVEFAGSKHGYGRIVVVRHNNFKTAYAHLNSIDVKVGARVSAATVIGAVGISGNASGPHLHFEVRDLSDATQDPMAVMPDDKLLTLAK
jgi:murein DD-endopeptidase MepM/ murein hydrolase activator NlpD